MSEKHTPGPWFVVEKMPAGGGIDIGPDIEGVGYHAQVTFNGGESEANAHLIAAAPELLEAAQRVEQALRRGEPINDRKNSVYGDMLRAAIAKAEGGE